MHNINSFYINKCIDNKGNKCETMSKYNKLLKFLKRRYDNFLWWKKLLGI